LRYTILISPQVVFKIEKLINTFFFEKAKELLIIKNRHKQCYIQGEYRGERTAPKNRPTRLSQAAKKHP
jgi:hypothetical protein